MANLCYLSVRSWPPTRSSGFRFDFIGKFDGGPVGMGSVAVAVGEDTSTLEDVHEPYLVMQGYLKRTPRGRVAMPAAYRKLGLIPPTPGQTELF